MTNNLKSKIGLGWFISVDFMFTKSHKFISLDNNCHLLTLFLIKSITSPSHPTFCYHPSHRSYCSHPSHGIHTNHPVIKVNTVI